MLASSMQRTLVLQRIFRLRGIELGRRGRRLESSDSSEPKSISVNRKRKENTSDSQIAHLIDKLRSSNRNSPGKFSEGSGSQRLRNVLKQGKVGDAKSTVQNIDELISEVKQSNVVEKDVDASVDTNNKSKESKIRYAENISSSDKKFTGIPEFKNKETMHAPRGSQADTHKSLRNLLSVGKVSTPKLRKPPAEGASHSEISEILEKPTTGSLSFTSHEESMQEAACTPDAEDAKPASESVNDAEAGKPPDLRSSLDDRGIPPQVNLDDVVRDPASELSSLRKLKTSKRNVPGKAEGASMIPGASSGGEDVSDFFTPDSLTTSTAEFSDLRAAENESKSVLDDLIAAQAEAAKDPEDEVFHSSPESSIDHKAGSETSGPSLSQYFQDFKSDNEVLLGQEMRKIMKKTTPLRWRRSAKGPEIFGPSRLGVFHGSVNACAPEIKEFVSSHEKDLQKFLQNLEASREPQNGFEAQMYVSDKLWQLPVDNETAKYHEENIGFEEHVFLDHLLDEFPSVPAVQQFMELVINGLQQNPYLSVQQKKERVMWFKEYFSQFSDDDFQLAVGRAAEM